jgi:hypothetical protein
MLEVTERAHRRDLRSARSLLRASPADVLPLPSVHTSDIECVSTVRLAGGFLMSLRRMRQMRGLTSGILPEAHIAAHEQEAGTDDLACVESYGQRA